MLNYTKGEWTIDFNLTIGHIKAVGEDLGARTPTVARYDIFSKFGGEIAEKRIEEEKANASLISAAPNMYEAIKEMLEYQQANGNLNGFNLSNIHKAIDKAEMSYATE